MKLSESASRNQCSAANSTARKLETRTSKQVHRARFWATGITNVLRTFANLSWITVTREEKYSSNRYLCSTSLMSKGILGTH